MTDPQTRIFQLQRSVRRWKRAALILSATLLLLVVGFGWLVTRAQVRAEHERAVAEDRRRVAEDARADAEARRAFLEKAIHQKKE